MASKSFASRLLRPIQAKKRYNEPEKRGFIWLNAISLTFTVLAIVFVLVAIGANFTAARPISQKLARNARNWRLAVTPIRAQCLGYICIDPTHRRAAP